MIETDAVAVLVPVVVAEGDQLLDAVQVFVLETVGVLVHEDEESDDAEGVAVTSSSTIVAEAREGATTL